MPRQNPSREVVDDGVHIGAGAVEQTDHGGVDVPHLVGACRPHTHLRLRWMHAEPRTSPSVRPHEAVPRRGRGADGAEPLREDRKRPSRHVTVGRRGHHVFDRVDLAARQAVR